MEIGGKEGSDLVYLDSSIEGEIDKIFEVK